ncbi:MAG: hypothetical protein SynsKO_25970 [Synoicihabitans sp.]
MKSKLTYLVLGSIVAFAAATATETLGLAVNAAWGYALPFVAFIVGLVALTFLQDYGRRMEPLLVTSPKAQLLPANEAFVAPEIINHRPAIARRRQSARVLAHS